MEGQRFRIPSLRHLLALKLHALKQAPASRELKDLKDIISLMIENHIDADQADFRDLCKKFGPAGIYRKIKEKYIPGDIRGQP